jgi:multidrug resistance protein, MATE family
MLLAGPLVAAQLAQISMGFVDTVMVGRLGSDALAGVALGNAVFFFFLIMCMGVILAVGPMVAQAYGAGQIEPIGRSVRQGLWLSVTLTIPAFVVIWNVGPLLRLAGQEPVAVEGAVRYVRAIVWGFLPFLWFVALRNFVEALSRPWPVTIIALTGVVLNIGCNYVLMFGKLGFPAMGLAGTGWASTIVFWYLFLVLFVFVRRHPPLRRYQVFSRLGRPDRQYFRELFRIGWPIGVALGIETGLFMITALLVGLISAEALAAHQIALQSAAFTFMVPLGIGLAAAVRVGQAVGRGDVPGARLAGFVSLLLASAFMFCAALVFWIVPEAVIALYLDVHDPASRDVVAMAVGLLGIAAVFQIFDGIQVSAAGALRGLKDTRIPMVIGFVSYWLIGLTAGVALGFGLGIGAKGLWWGLVLGLAAAAILLSWRFNRMSQVMRATPGAELRHRPS